MNKTGARVVILLMVIPLLLIITTSTVVNVTEILVDVPVSSITILGDENLHIEIDAKNANGEYDNSYKIETVVEPQDATHKDVKFDVREVEGKVKAEVVIDENGVVRPLSEGTVQIVAMAGSRSDSIQITYTSESVYDLKVKGDGRFVITEGKEENLKTYLGVYPENAKYVPETKVDKPLKLSFDPSSGAVKARAKGNAVLDVRIPGIKIDAESGKVSDYTHEAKLTLEVSRANTAVGVSFAGNNTLHCATTDVYETEFSFDSTQQDFLNGEITYECNDPSGIENVDFQPQNDDTVKMAITLSDSAAENKIYVLTVKLNGTAVAEVYVKNAAIYSNKVRVSYVNDYFSVNTGNIVFGIRTETGEGDKYFAVFSSSDPDVLRFKGGVASAESEGSAEVSCKLYDSKGRELDVEVEPMTVHVVDSYVSVGFNDKKRGLKNELVIAGNNVNETASGVAENVYEFSLSGSLSSNKKTQIIDNARERIKWSSSDEEIAVVENGKLRILSSGEVTIRAESAYNEKLGLTSPVLAEFTVVCRKDAVSVKDYDSLMYASKQGKETVLTSDVMLAPRIGEKDFDDYRAYLEECTTKMRTTADYSYYKDNGKPEDAFIRYCVEFTASVYGNGYTICGEYVTRCYDYNQYRIFDGPLDIVRLSYNLSSAENARVKAQDNVVFIVKKDGINIDNVELKGCKDESLVEEKDGVKTYNLGKLDKCGTVLEIVGDRCNLSYSRVNNGRTVVRVFGRAEAENNQDLINNPSAYKINATINNSILESAREFILKIGSNQSKKNPPADGVKLQEHKPTDEDYENAGPALLNASGFAYQIGQNNLEDEYFCNNYVMTDVTLRDCAFFNAGLFSIGMESKFAGVVLHGFDYNDKYNFSKLGWKNVAGTSYPAVLRMEGEVRFYDWKNIDNLNSDTLIEGNLAQLKSLINLDLKQLLTSYNKANPSLLVMQGGKTYVNGAIAFYGGGKNYSQVDLSGVSEKFASLASYSVGMDVFESRQVVLAAGQNDFRFMLYDSTHGITVTKQQNDLHDPLSYTWMARR